MRTAKSWSDKAVAGVVVRPYKPFEPGKIVRATAWNIIVGAVLIAAARDAEGWLSIALWVLLGFRALPYLFLGLAQRAKDEHLARLNALPAGWRDVLTADKHLFADRKTS